MKAFFVLLFLMLVLAIYGQSSGNGPTQFPPPLLRTNGANALTKQFPRYTNTLQDFRALAHYLNRGGATTNLTLSGDMFFMDETADSWVGITNFTLIGRGFTIYSYCTNVAPWPQKGAQIIVSGSGDIEQVCISNVLAVSAGQVAITTVNCTNLVLKDSQFYVHANGAALNVGDNPCKAYATNCLFYVDGIDGVENSFSFWTTPTNCVVSNCIVVATGPRANAIEPASNNTTNLFYGCSFFCTNGGPLGFHTNDLLADVFSDPCKYAFTNCNFYCNQDLNAYFDRSNQDGSISCCMTLSSTAQNNIQCDFANCTFNLAWQGYQTPLGTMCDASGNNNLTSIGVVRFINCTVIPDPGNNVIFYNNGFPVTIGPGGNLTTANFSEPSAVTVQ